MARSASNALAVIRSIIASDAAMLLFVSIDLPALVPGGQARQVRLVQDTKHRTANGVVWQRADIAAEFPAENADGGIDSVSLTISNIAGVATPMVLRGELSGRVVTLYMAASNLLDEFDPALTWVLESTTVQADMGAGTITITCDSLGVNDFMPREILTRDEFPQLGSPT